MSSGLISNCWWHSKNAELKSTSTTWFLKYCLPLDKNIFQDYTQSKINLKCFLQGYLITSYSWKLTILKQSQYILFWSNKYLLSAKAILYTDGMCSRLVLHLQRVHTLSSIIHQMQILVGQGRTSYTTLGENSTLIQPRHNFTHVIKASISPSLPVDQWTLKNIHTDKS